MKNNNNLTEQNLRENERGAALVMVLLVSSLMLIVGAALILAASMNSANVTDSVSEEQAYYAAESGIQSAINVLRGNATPLPTPTPAMAMALIESATPTPTPSKITYRQAVSLSSSNAPGDSSTESRLSRWISGYTYTDGAADRVNIGGSSNLGFRLSLQEPVTSNNIVTYSTYGTINGSTTPYTVGSGANKVTFKINDRSTSDINVATGTANTDLGSFDIRVNGNGAILSNDIRFSIVYRMTFPAKGSRVIRGWIRRSTSAITDHNIGTLKIEFDSPYYEVMGSRITMVNNPLTPTLPGTSALTTIRISVTPPEPQRIAIRSTGFGPRGAQKQLEALIQKDLFGGLYAPATITMVGSSTGFTFNQGNSNVTTYSGLDTVSPMMLPPIGTAVPGFNIDALSTQIANSNVNVVGYPGDVTEEIPDWLKTSTDLDATIQQLRLIAQSSGGYYASGVTPTNFGNFATGTGITFADGNVSLTGAGGGILICTGKLTLDGNYSFKGLIIVTGASGVQRHGGGNGSLLGNLVVAPYNPSNLAAGFTGPKYDLSGGGNSTIRYDSSSVFNGLAALDNIVLGVAEK